MGIASTKFRTKERNVNDTRKHVQRQRRCATEPTGVTAHVATTLGYRFRIITNPEWPNGVAPSFTVQLGGTPSGFTAEWACPELVEGLVDPGEALGSSRQTSRRISRRRPAEADR